MPSRKKNTKKSSKAVAAEQPTKRARRTKKVVEPKVEEEPVSDVELREEKQEVVEVSSKKRRSKPTKESVLQLLQDVVDANTAEIARLRASPKKSKGVKHLSSMNKQLKTVLKQAGRVMKQRRTSEKKSNSNSGFLKPVAISEELANFAGWDKDELKSRRDVTKYICNYIKEKDLQNPEDRRIIFAEKDKKLRSLLKYNPSSAEPLTYYRLQTYLKGHYPKSQPEQVKVKAEAKPKSKSRAKKSS